MDDHVGCTTTCQSWRSITTFEYDQSSSYNDGNLYELLEMIKTMKDEECHIVAQYLILTKRAIQEGNLLKVFPVDTKAWWFHKRSSDRRINYDEQALLQLCHSLNEFLKSTTRAYTQMKKYKNQAVEEKAKKNKSQALHFAIL